MVFANFLRTHRADDQQWRPGIEAEQILEPVQRLAVDPLHVIQEQQERRPALARGGSSICHSPARTGCSASAGANTRVQSVADWGRPEQHACQGLKQARALPGLGQRPRELEMRSTGHQHRGDARNFDQPGVVQASQACREGGIAQPFGDWRIGKGSAAYLRVTACGSRGDSSPGNPGVQLLCQARLADAGFALQQEHLRRARGCGVPDFKCARPLGFPTDQRKNYRLRLGRSAHETGTGPRLHPDCTLVDILGGAARRGVKFLAQHRHAGLIDASCFRSLSQGQMQAHQVAISRFVQ